jgi:hypothetical protein
MLNCSCPNERNLNFETNSKGDFTMKIIFALVVVAFILFVVISVADFAQSQIANVSAAIVAE